MAVFGIPAVVGAQELPESPTPQVGEAGRAVNGILAQAPFLVAREAGSGGLQQPNGAGAPAEAYGSISGYVTDETGAGIAGATVQLVWDAPLTGSAADLKAEVKTDGGGQFTFVKVGGGKFQLRVTANGFASKTFGAVLAAGQAYTAPQITLSVAASSTEVNVGLTHTDIAQIQLDTEEKQRLVGVFPNFYVSYAPNPMPLSPKQKFTLAGKLLIDPVSFGITGVSAGIQQANDTYSGFGQGAGGYAKRYAASTGTFLDSILIGNVILPVVLKQDPRYFYKGTGTVRSRIWYAVAMSVVAKGDNGHWQPNYSGILGGLAAAGISNFYYPEKDRDGVELTFVNAAIGTAESAAGNIVQEFVFRRLTSHAAKASKAVSGTP